MARMERDRHRREDEEKDSRRTHKSLARHSSLKSGDPSRAPKFGEQKAVGDGQSINVPGDALGVEVEAFSVGSNLKGAGEANYTGSFKDFVGDENMLPDKDEGDEAEDDDDDEEDDDYY